MSNGTFTYTPEQVTAHFAQFSKAMELTRERLRDPETVTSALQAIISDNVNVHFIPKVNMGSDPKIFHVRGNFATIAEAFDAGKYKRHYGYVNKPRQIPHIVQPVDVRVRAVPLDKPVKVCELFRLYPRMVDPMTLATFGACFPNEQLKISHLTVWRDQEGQFWSEILDRRVGERGVSVTQCDPDCDWFDPYCVLVREL